MRKLWINLSLILLLSCLAMTGNLFAQAGGDTSKGSIGVEVLDSSGAMVPNASVTLDGPMGIRKTSTDGRGAAVFYSLAPAVYSVKVEFQGFRTASVQNILVNAAERTPVQVRLEPGQLTEVVQVSETAIAVDTTSTTTGANLNADVLQNIPIARNVASLFSLAAGAAPSGGTDNNATPNESYNPSVSGATGLENQYIIDGINATDQGYGAFGVWSNVYGSMGSGVNFDFIKQVQVKTGGFEAQYGQALGGVINVVTHSGSNEVHGSVYAYSSPGWSEATYRQPNDLRVSSPTTERHGRGSFDFGVNLGGPIMKNKFFWYGGFNPKFTTLDRLGPNNFGTRTLGVQEWKSRNYNWVGKLNYTIADNHRLEGTAFGDPSRDPIGVHRSLLRDDLDAESKSEYGTRNWAVKYDGLWTKTTVFNASFARNHTYFVETPTKNTFSIRDYGKPKPNAAYTLLGGVGFLENNDGDNSQYNAMMTQTVNFLGGHQFDVGYAFSQVKYDALRIYSGPDWALPQARGVAAGDVGQMTHGGFFYFYPTRSVGGVTQRNVYRHIRGNFSDPNVETATDYHNSFVQDAWQIGRHLTAKLGVRWEQQEINGNQNKYTFAANWAPRLGFIIDPTGNRKMKLFANWGRFFEKIPQDLAVRAMSEEAGYLNLNFFGLPPTQANLVPGSVGSPSGTHPTIIFGGTKAQYQEEVVAGAEREFPGGWVLGARFIYRDLKRTIEDISGVTVEAYNAGISQDYVIANPSKTLDIFQNPVACTSGPNCDPDTGFTTNSGLLGPDGKVDLFPNPRRIYKALEITADRRFGNNWSFTANYRLAKLFGNYEGLFRNDNGQSDPNITSLFDFVYSEALGDQFSIGVLPSDRRHIANFYGNYMVKGNFNIGLGYQTLSGAPLSKFLAHPGYGNAGEIPVGGRGAFGRTPTQNYFNMRLDYTIPLKSERLKLKLAADMFNLFNRRTTTSIDQDFELSGAVPNGDFAKPLEYHRPFYSRFSVRLEF